MEKLFKHAASIGIKYDKYEIRKTSDGTEYVMPANGAKVVFTDPLEKPDKLVIDALNTALAVMHDDENSRPALMEFISEYGLLGFMTALPPTSDFESYERVFLPFNEFIKEETMDTLEYIDLFFPFKKPDVIKTGDGFSYSVENDNEMVAFMMVFKNLPISRYMIMNRDYAERYDWLVNQFKSWAFIYFTNYFYYLDQDTLSEETKISMRRSMALFNTNIPSYHMELHENHAEMVWDFNSLLLCVQLMFCFEMTDDKTSLRICKNCMKVYKARKDMDFCCKKCKDAYERKKRIFT